MKYILIISILCLPSVLPAQQLHGDIYGGLANYSGDLQGKRYTFNHSGAMVGLGISYDINNKFTVRGVATYLNVGADDKYNTTATGVTFRNLNFKTHIQEAQLALEYNFFDLTERSFTPYLFAGVAAFHFQPYSYDTLGNKVLLRPLSTEGEGLAAYPDRKPYNTKQLAIPFGGGVKFALSDRILLGVEISLRKLFTDYLD
ncbi:MAG: outer membrane beta-barrel protein, partial [Bacteroidetes bacterium]|nr:outer membrane beta-barrel protein [Bacteroidota bacterium]